MVEMLTKKVKKEVEALKHGETERRRFVLCWNSVQIYSRNMSRKGHFSVSPRRHASIGF